MRYCEKCGAKLIGKNANTTTCSPICTKAKHNGLTLREQIAKEESEPIPEPDGTGCQICGCRWCICAER